MLNDAKGVNVDEERGGDETVEVFSCIDKFSPEEGRMFSLL